MSRIRSFIKGDAEYISMRDGRDVHFPGGYWEIPSAEDFDIPQGVTDTAALSSLDEPARLLAERLLDPSSDLSDLSPPVLVQDETHAQRASYLAGKIIETIKSHQI